MSFESFYNWEFPDRAEILWARIGGGRGPGAFDRTVDFQEIRFKLEQGGEAISAWTEFPLRSIDPENNNNTTAQGDQEVGTKIVLFSEGRLILTQVFRTYIPTSIPSRGLGTGHVSLEPGFLGSFQASCTTIIHGEIKYWFPLGGDPVHQGQVLRYGLGMSHLLYERPNSDFAITSTLEMLGFVVLDGQQTIDAAGTLQDIDGTGILSIYPGFRFLLRERFELGLGGGFSISESHFEEAKLSMTMRVFF